MPTTQLSKILSVLSKPLDAPPQPTVTRGKPSAEVFLFILSHMYTFLNSLLFTLPCFSTVSQGHPHLLYIVLTFCFSLNITVSWFSRAKCAAAARSLPLTGTTLLKGLFPHWLSHFAVNGYLGCFQCSATTNTRTTPPACVSWEHVQEILRRPPWTAEG